jgi:hypothetical protein
MSGEALRKAAFPIFNGYAPVSGGAKGMPITFDFSTLASIDFDLIIESASGLMENVQSMWIDNSANPRSLTLTFTQTGQRVVVPKFAQGTWPVSSPDGLRCTISTTAQDGLKIPVILLNVPMAMAQYGPVVFANLITATFSIANGASLSSAVDLGSARLFALQMPAAWTAANLSAQASADGVTYDEMLDDSGLAIAIVSAVSTYIVFQNPVQWLGVRYLKLRSGTSGVPVAQGAARSITAILVP